MSKIEQRTIEHFFKENGIVDQQQKAKFLPQITDLVYEYNMAVVRLDREEDEYKKKQIETDVSYTIEKINNILTGKDK